MYLLLLFYFVEKNLSFVYHFCSVSFPLIAYLQIIYVTIFSVEEFCLHLNSVEVLLSNLMRQFIYECMCVRDIWATNVDYFDFRLELQISVRSAHIRLWVRISNDFYLISHELIAINYILISRHFNKTENMILSRSAKMWNNAINQQINRQTKEIK